MTTVQISTPASEPQPAIQNPPAWKRAAAPNSEVKTITTPLIIRTPLGDYYAKHSARPAGLRLATPAASLREGVYAPLAITDFTATLHVVEQRATTLRVKVA